MKVTITRENFQKGLSAVAATIPTRTTLPVLSNILVETVEGGVRVRGTDLDISVSVETPAEVESQGAITVPAKKVADIARELPDAPVEFRSEGGRVSLVCGKAKFKLHSLPSDEYPSFPEVPFSEGWRLKGGELQKMSARTSFAVSSEETRPVLNGVLWQLRDAEMRMVATNGHRLAKMAVKLETAAAGDEDLIVPPKALQQVEKLFASDAELEIARSESHLGFRTEKVEVYTRLIEGPYPNYEQVLPKDNDKECKADREQLAAALRRVAIVASDQTHRVRLAFAPERLSLGVQTPDLGEAEDELPVEYVGSPLEIGFNANYLLEVLRYIGTEEVKITLAAPERPATFEPAAGDEDYVCLVMPLRLME
ncbi:MAG: DNA polymerase III subunit beta [Gemmatimonadetes bacterium]|uniref:Beta sliding clamp n=1 Tax=Candidatus Kutchimonas denitrificans TaxID=3056748 RepID=A0AAE5CB57_9BACT|nr:DNA polymerase III subunit beta [Gemmatimonadota bacterium]NIR74133.1 DNA polymerase III subunit beta [Candidatus Kutchimonas denitrificans]NIS01315.1 DNA polymerase III subunit beta [Gemmatimonadota bacterium]NIT67046.1 DNA polymerase III subunit beta [Gemmatimonadota bacterium]NIU51706.1 DNA polymerase III subunit beta [Gemmatimonadota bacterium]